jgi:hypothetical protein
MPCESLIHGWLPSCAPLPAGQSKTFAPLSGRIAHEADGALPPRSLSCFFVFFVDLHRPRPSIRRSWPSRVNNLQPVHVSYGMKIILLNSLESLLSVKRQRLSLARSLRSRIVLKREIQQLQHQIEELRARPL